MKKIFGLIIVISSFIACKKQNLIIPERISLSKYELEMLVGKQEEMFYSIYPQNINKDLSMVWICSNENVASISQGGVITAKEKGEATIELYVKDYSDIRAKTKLMVDRAPIKEVGFAANMRTIIKKGSIEEIKLLISPNYITDPYSLNYYSSNSIVAGIDSILKNDGEKVHRIRAKNAGTTMIKVWVSGSSPEIGAECEILVTD